MENQRDPKEETPSVKAPSSNQEGESRREFIKKLPYIAPMVQTFLLSETAFADDEGGDDDKDKDNDNNGNDDNEGDWEWDDDDDDEGQGRARGRRRVSPHNRGRGRG